jgi:hypothetical protein
MITINKVLPHSPFFHFLFLSPASPQAELKKLHKAIIANLNQAIGDAVDKAIIDKFRTVKRTFTM